MTKVTRKIFAVMELIASKGGRGVLPSEVVEALALNQTTCIRILKDLVELGYLEQISRQRGYVLGPMANWLAGACVYKRELLETAKPLVEDCAKKAAQSVLLAIRRKDRRFVLAHSNYNVRMHVDVAGPYWQDFYYTATGRLLLAYASEAELKSVFQSLGAPPPSDWPEAPDFKSLLRETASIRAAGFVSFERGKLDASADCRRRVDLYILACPVWSDGAFEAALGMSVPCRELESQEGKERYNELLKDCAASMNAKLTAVKSAG